MFFTLLPFSAFYGFAKKHISRNESRLENKVCDLFLHLEQLI